jgi:hypothetical protein
MPNTGKEETAEAIPNPESGFAHRERRRDISAGLVLCLSLLPETAFAQSDQEGSQITGAWKINFVSQTNSRNPSPFLE